MIIIDNTIVSTAFLQAHFICDLSRCKGNCCVLGDAGAPLDEKEIGLLEDQLDGIRPYMTEAGLRVVDEQGVFDYDAGGQFVTPLVNDRECAFTNFHQNGVSYCAIEKAFSDGNSSFRKPVSCHLYPVRLAEKDGFIHILYHQWSICVPAVRKGNQARLPLYVFLKEALIRRFGAEWYDRLDKEAGKG
ncbi:MAG: DUF3109 family protein [Bacteroidales bacterium]|nr:DUF3109 family protein [Bacteroidales bacterium]